MKLIFASLLVASTVQAKDMSQDELALSFVQEQQISLRIAEQANDHILDTAIGCFEQHRCLRDAPKGYQCPGSRRFTKVEKLFGGGKVNVELDCEKLFEEYFGIKLKQQPRFTSKKEDLFNEARLHLALSAPALKEGNPQHAINPQNTSMILDSTPASLVPRWSSGFGVQYKHPESLSKKEVLRLQSYYASHLESWLSEFWKLHRDQLSELSFESSDGKYGEIIRARFLQNPESCNIQEILLFQIHLKDCGGGEERLLSQDLLGQFANWVYQIKLPAFREDQLQSYLEIMLNNPIFFQLSSARMTDQDLWGALRAMKEASDKKRTKNFTNSSDWRDYLSGSNLLNTSLFSSTHFRVQHDLSAQEYIELTQIIQDEYQAQLQKGAYKNGAVLAGSLALCLFPNPVKSALTLSVRVVFNSACLTILGLPINTYLLIEGIRKKAQSWNTAISAADSNIQIDDIASLSEEDSALFINAAFMPLILRIDGKIIKSLSNPHLLRRALEQLRAKGRSQ